MDNFEWRFLVTGGVLLQSTGSDSPHEWLSQKTWLELIEFADLSGIYRLKEDVQNYVLKLIINNMID